MLWILFNFSTQRHRIPTIEKLEIKIGRDQEDIFAGLHGLVEEQYIFSPDNPRLDTIVILKAREQENPSHAQAKPEAYRGYIDYWTKY
ncbi:hypothetical protein PAMA110636_30095 [Paenibacillus macerans]